MPFIALAPIIASVATFIGGAAAGAAIAAPIVAGVSAADIIGGALIGAGGGALLGGLEGGGKGALTGALTGGLTGGALSFAPAIGGLIAPELGIGTTGATALAGTAIGAGVGALGGAITGTGPLQGAETGGIAGLASGLMAPAGGAGTGTTAAAPAGGTAPGGSPSQVSIPASGGTAAAAAQGDIGAMAAQGGSVWSGPGSQVTASPISTTAPPSGGTISGGQVGTGAVGTGNVDSPAGTYATGGPYNLGSSGQIQAPTQTGGAYATGGPYSVSGAGDIQAPVQTTTTGGSNILGNIGSWLTKNPGALLAGGGLLMSMMQQGDTSKEMSALENAAAADESMARALDAPLFSGVLPPGAQAALDQSRANQQAQTRSVYASLGMSGSTGETEALGAVDQNVAAQQFAMENELFSQAAGYAGMASQNYMDILQQQRLQDEDFSNALSRFVMSLSGGMGGTKATA
jgi:hypothetical protein